MRPARRHRAPLRSPAPDAGGAARPGRPRTLLSAPGSAVIVGGPSELAAGSWLVPGEETGRRNRARRRAAGGSVAGAGQSPVRGPVFGTPLPSLGVSRTDRRSGGRVPGCWRRPRLCRGAAPTRFRWEAPGFWTVSRVATPPLSPKKGKQDEVRGQGGYEGANLVFSLCPTRNQIRPSFFFFFCI